MDLAMEKEAISPACGSQDSQRVALSPPFVVQNFHINYSYLHWLGTYYKKQEECLDLRPH
jgi:hypothetical protein